MFHSQGGLIPSSQSGSLFAVLAVTSVRVTVSDFESLGSDSEEDPAEFQAVSLDNLQINFYFWWRIEILGICGWV